jgi:1-acyl-sn-glycerol-3-phosphate acyltransferase
VTPVDRVLAAIAAAGRERSAANDVASAAGRTPPADAQVGELLSSLDRVELAARLEDLYGAVPDEALFTGELSIGELAAAESSRGSAPEVARSIRRAPDEAAWRHRLPARATRWGLREGVMHPLARLLVRVEVESAVAAGELPAPFLLAANHTSLLDPLVMFALPPRLRARLAPAARWNFFTEHPRGAFLYFWGVLGLDLFPLVQSGDWRPTLRIGGELADRGHSILIYPEGRISEDGAVHELKLGVAVMSRDLHLPIVPCATAGLERVLPPGSRRPQRESWRRPVVAVCIGEPIPAARPDEDLGDLVESLGQRIRRLHNQARAIRDRRERRGDRPSATQ